MVTPILIICTLTILLLAVFAYPREKGSIQDSSRLEDDPLLSVLIDSMHVDEVQLDGGGIAAVVTGNMENPVSAPSSLKVARQSTLNGPYEFRQCGPLLAAIFTADVGSPTMWGRTLSHNGVACWARSITARWPTRCPRPWALS